jgi:endonuclease/exonuclease/phosphatase family metal-dependent hydrolase
LLRGRLSLTAAIALLLVGWIFARTPSLAGRTRPPTARQTGPAPPSAPQNENASAFPPPAVADAAAGPKAPGAAVDPFASAASCAALVGARQRLARASGTARFASWNLHWFPDGEPGRSASGAELGWLACAMTWLDADVLAVQEVKQSPHAEQALSTVLAELNRLSGARYVARLDDCGSRVPQHVGLIWNEARVTASDVETVAELNPHGSACQSQLRPGLAARFRLPGGLDLAAVSAHFKSMGDQRALRLRGLSFAAVPGVLRGLTTRTGDADFLLLGDLNTMGCSECAPVISSRDELTSLERQLLAGGLRVVAADAAGSELYEGRTTLLDHALASASMRELAPSSRSHVTGACAAGARPLTRRAAKRLSRSLSDHCPIVLDLIDRDLD